MVVSCLFARGLRRSLGRWLRNDGSRRPLRRRNHDIATAGARNGAPDEKQLALRVDANDFEVLHGAFRRTEMTRHFLSGEHAAGVLRHADRARFVMRERVTVARTVRREVMALDD